MTNFEISQLQKLQIKKCSSKKIKKLYKIDELSAIFAIFTILDSLPYFCNTFTKSALKGHPVCNRYRSSPTNVVVHCKLEILQVNQLLGRQLNLILKMKGLFIRSRCRKWRQKVKVKRQQQQKCCNNLQMHDIFHGIMRGCQKSP